MATSNRRTTSIGLVLAGALALVGCGGGAEKKDAEPKPSPTPTAEAATPEQLASVIAGSEAAWREVIDQAADCRFKWVMGDETDPMAEMEGMSCYMREVTIGMTAKQKSEELTALEAPESMTALVDETEAALTAIADIDLTTPCGEPTQPPADSDDCSGAIGNRMNAYRVLETVLDKWRPYL